MCCARPLLPAVVLLVGLPYEGLRAQVSRAPAPSVTATDTASTITLPRALERARLARPQVGFAAAGVIRARGSARVASTIPNPVIAAQGDERAPTRQATAVQPLGWLLRRGADVGVGRAVVSRATADSAQLLADVGRDVQRAFFGALAAEERLRLATAQAQMADSLVMFADRRVAAGDISALERDLIAQEASRARLTAALARSQAREARVDFGRAVAWEARDVPRPVGPLDEALNAVDGGLRDVEHGPDAVPTSVPTLRAALADSVGASARLRAMTIAQFPMPALLVGVEWGAAQSLSGVRDARTTPIFGLSLPFPIWNQGREAVAEARGVALEAYARTAEARLLLAAQLSRARIRATESALRARFARDSLFPEATRIRVGAVRLYEAGRTSLLPAMDALRVERDIGQTLVQELLAFQEARADLAALLGQWPGAS